MAGATLLGPYSREQKSHPFLKECPTLAVLVSLSIDQLQKYIAVGVDPTVTPTATLETLS
jgi:hypothetical protein